jgi:alpha-tubulin suppressor-like RCC1 family protein
MRVRRATYHPCVTSPLTFSHTLTAAVTEKGEVVQWGTGFDESPTSEEPRVTLSGCDVDSLACTAHKIFALTRSGAIYAFPSRYSPEPPTDTRPWYGGFFGPPAPGVRLVKLTPDVPLENGERFVSVDAGEHHVVARTDAGRAFAVPVDANANTHGQLGLRKVELSDGRATTLAPDENLERRTLGGRPASATPPTSPQLLTFGDRPSQSQPPTPAPASPDVYQAERKGDGQAPVVAEDVNWDDVACCTRLHEIPALRGVRLAEIHAGDTHTVARTVEGRLLGWGNNSFG